MSGLEKFRSKVVALREAKGLATHDRGHLHHRFRLSLLKGDLVVALDHSDKGELPGAADVHHRLLYYDRWHPHPHSG